MFNDFETQIHPEETTDYSDYVNAEELAAIENEDWEEVESDDGHRELYEEDFEAMAEFAADILNYESIDDMLDGQNQFDEARDLDFYDS